MKLYMVFKYLILSAWWRQLSNHPIQFVNCTSRSLALEHFEAVSVFGPKSFFSSFHNQAALDPHLDAV